MKNQLNNLNKNITKIRNEITEYIKNIPNSSSNITMINKNCGIIKSSELNNNNWSPNYYINSDPKSMLINILNYTKIENFAERIKFIIEKKQIKNIKLNDEFINNLKKIILDEEHNNIYRRKLSK